MYSEPFLSERIEKAKKKAFDIVNKNHNTIEDSVYYLRYILSRHYNMPFFHEYFEQRTIEELIFEIELIKQSEQSNVEKGKDLLASNKEEAEGLFDDMVKEDEEEMNNVDSFNDLAQEFIRSGKFKGEE